ncbi:twin-arginine translocation pathway signal protein [Sphingobium sp. SCG-1]|uniref:murein L,D-transpeptidase catalytic domain family protein n=1 Tax=Sphingobium sp. SCG-1 TaxID=2072936 RepID=UPI000CD687D5|nr:murein L,D-transpeptidase catalytic domain family protein [Sphingobium sp. SCG-1]AUW58031.1 twin-arginine translocation pathway signal protein [Sphingobium sp. SCG-1]
MNRREFTRYAFAGLGFAALSPSMAGNAIAEGLVPSKPVLPPPTPPASKVFPAGLGTRFSAKLLDRARAALDVHQRSFELRDRVALADFSAASKDLRFHIVDLIGGQTSSYLVAHGRGSDPEHSGWLQSFSNVPDSLATSAGAYKTGEIYQGIHGQSMRLLGLDPLNNNAEMRAIVVHGADYVSEDHIARWGKCGRSEGCLAVAPHMLPQVLGLLGPGRMVYADKV